MPELLEVESYRRLADQTIGRTIAEVDAHDTWFLKGVSAQQVIEGLTGARIRATDRRGKLLTVDLGPERPVLGLRFGMTGRLLLDGHPETERLIYAPGRDDPSWDRFALVFTDGARLRITDPRRLGGVELDPDLSRLGPEAALVTGDQLRGALGASSAALKARLLDQRHLAGLGNLLVDEILWRAGLRPNRPAHSLDRAEVDLLAATIRSTVADLGRKGGSNRGDLQDQRHRDGSCPLDGTPLQRDTSGSRTTYWCPTHQT